MLSTAVSDRLAVDVADAQALKYKAASGDPAALRAAARQFEAMMVAQMLKGMRQTHFSNAEEDPFGSQTMKLYQDMLDQQWASRISQGRGLGYAEMLTKALQAQAQPAATAPASKPASGSSGQDDMHGMTTVTSSSSAGLPITTPATAEVKTAMKDFRRAFIERLRPQAEAAAKATGVPADFILAHAALESGWGAREIRSSDGQPSHNLFGIKAGSDWQGGSVSATTTEYSHGRPLHTSQNFRSYDDYGQAFEDYARLLNTRYGTAVSSGKDAHAFAQGLADGGYATDPAYTAKLQAVIAKVAMTAA